MTIQRRSRGNSAGLSRAAVVQTAADIAERVGFTGTTMRAVAKELGVTPMAVYNHIGSIDELLDEVADHFVTRILGGLPSSGPPLARVRQMAHALRLAGIANPGVLTSIAGYIPERAPSAHFTYCDRMLDQLIAAGADEQRAHDIYTAIICLCLGTAVAATNLSAERPTPLADRLRLHAEYYRDAHIANYLRTPHPSEQFLDRQLDLLLSGLSANQSP